MFPSGVMVVDDDKSILRLMKAKLRSAGIECETVDSAEMAIQQANKKPCSVVVSDIDMPGMNGVELIAALKLDSFVKTPVSRKSPTLTLAQGPVFRAISTFYE